MPRQITYAQAVTEAIDICMERDRSVFIIGEGVPDPKGIFGTTLGLQKKYGKDRVMDMPLSENGITGVCIGAALYGMHPILVHQRIDFSLLSLDQIVNVAAKWYFMFGKQQSVPIVIRMIIGRGWGQGAQHSQSLQALYAHIPGLKVVMPATPHDIKGLMIAAIQDNNPIIIIEHRWLHNVMGDVPMGYFEEKIGKSKVISEGKDLTLVATSYMTFESLKALKILQPEGIFAELIDVRTIKPFDVKTVLNSVKKTGKLVVADTGVKTLGFAGEVIASVCELAYPSLKVKPARITLPDLPTPTSWKMAEKYYPTYIDIVEACMRMLNIKRTKIEKLVNSIKSAQKIPSDVPDTSFTGPF